MDSLVVPTIFEESDYFLTFKEAKPKIRSKTLMSLMFIGWNVSKNGSLIAKKSRHREQRARGEKERERERERERRGEERRG